MSAVGDWEACGDAFFSRELLYEMVWEDVDLESRRCARSQHGALPSTPTPSTPTDDAGER